MTDENASHCGPLDDYERRYMDGARAIARAQQRMPRWLAAFAVAYFMAVPWLNLPASSDAQSASAVVTLTAMSLVYGIAIAAVLLLQRVTRVVVTETHLRVHRGLRGSDVALDAIHSVSLERMGFLQGRFEALFGSMRGDALYLLPNNAPALKVRWRDTNGSDRTLWAMFDDAPAILAQLQSRTGRVTGVRASEEPIETRDEIECLARESEPMAREHF